MSKELVSIIVVSAKVSVYLTACLDSLKAQDYPYLEIFLVDTSSEADLNQSLAAGSPIITLLHSPNASYCQALNIGIENSKGKFILCLNDDAVLGKGFINESFKGFSINKNVGMVSGKILRFDKQTIDSAGLSVSIDEREYRPRVGNGAYEAKLLKPQNIVEMLANGKRRVMV
ncbi:MAG: glycosyltransferase [Candidatus Omnitrophica bacterium]|nr:glycosyltransferase [Candidatus Omnitrophota bacterium]